MKSAPASHCQHSLGLRSWSRLCKVHYSNVTGCFDSTLLSKVVKLSQNKSTTRAGSTRSKTQGTTHIFHDKDWAPLCGCWLAQNHSTSPFLTKNAWVVACGPAADTFPAHTLMSKNKEIVSLWQGGSARFPFFLTEKVRRKKSSFRLKSLYTLELKNLQGGATRAVCARAAATHPRSTLALKWTSASASASAADQQDPQLQLQHPLTSRLTARPSLRGWNRRKLFHCLADSGRGGGGLLFVCLLYFQSRCT